MWPKHESATLNVEYPQSFCQFGQAWCDITPPVGIYHRMWGAATHDRSTGIHTPLQATATIFRPISDANGGCQVLVALDHCLLLANEMTALRDHVCKTVDVNPDDLVITFSHTHAAGLMGSGRVSLPGGDLIPDYLQSLAQNVCEIIKQARSNVTPCYITYGIGRCSLAANRDLWDADSNQFVCGYNPQGQADDTVLVARVTDVSGRVRGVFVNYACHPTTLAWQNTLISADFVHACRELIKGQMGDGVICTFLQGASGDLGPKVGFVGEIEQADRNGRQLGYATLEALESLPPAGASFQYTGPVISGATIGTWQFRPLDEQMMQQSQRFETQRYCLNLPYRSDLPTLEQCRQEREQWLAAEESAKAANDSLKARDARAMVERLTRMLHRLEQLPEKVAFPYPINIWRIGDAIWIAVEGELYQDLQVRIRNQFPKAPIMVITLANGSRCSYLPRRDAYGKGIYQETVALLAPGCLENVIESILYTVQTILEPGN